MRLAQSLRRLLALPDAERRVGPFLLVRQLGRGGFAPVWLARETYGAAELRLAAVKLFALSPRIAGQADQRRVVDEARALCQVEHPNIVRFYSIAIDEAAGVAGVAMEYLTGTPLDARLGAGPCSVDETLLLGVSIASALSAVHRAGLVHRDVKPANILDSGGTYKLIDFGIAGSNQGADVEDREPVVVDDLPLEASPKLRRRVLDDASLSVQPESSAGTARGTAGYVDPVCLSTGTPPTVASDLYALGVVLFECVAGRHPASVTAPAGRGLDPDVLHGRRRVPAVATVAPDVHPALGALVDALLAAAPAERPRSAERVTVELERIRGEVDGLHRDLPPEAIGPFRGLGRFEGADRDVYFGRSVEVAMALERLRGQGVVALIGPSGSGKSSLARAGALPRVAEGAMGRWPPAWDAAVAVPGRDPRAAILGALCAIPGLEGLGEDAAPEAVVVALAERVASSDRGVVLLVDQLEELVTLGAGPSQRWAAELLVALGEVPRPGVRALVTVRRDLLDALLAFEGLGKTLVRGSLLVEPIRDTTWAEVIRQALAAYGYALEDDALGAELLAQLEGSVGAMPLIQFALTELWSTRDVDRKLVTRAGLATIGGIAGSLERHADATVARIARAHGDGARFVREILLALTTPQGTRAVRPARELEHGVEPAWREVLAELERARLVVRDADEVTLAHEALLTQWGALRSWVAEVRDDRVLADEAHRDGVRWRAAPDLVPLWKRQRLDLADELSSRGDVTFSADAVAFLDAGRRADRRARLVAFSGALALGLAVTAAVAGYVTAARQAERDARAMASVEQQKASLEQQKRLDLEHAQSELDRRQKQIDELLDQLSGAQDARTVLDVRRKLREAEQGAVAARAQIAVPVPAAKARAAVVEAPVASPSPTPTAAPALKIQE